MNPDQWTQMLEYSFQTIWVEVSRVLPALLGALLILFVGYLIASGVKGAIVHMAKKLHIDEQIKSTGATEAVERSGYTLNMGEFIGTLVKWFIIAVFFVAALDVLNLNEVTEFLSEVVLGYLPRVIVATAILFGGVIVAQIVEQVIAASARIARFTSPQLLSKFAKYAVLGFAILAALNELQVATELVQMLFGGMVFALSLALGLSFGLGGKEAAARYIESQTRSRM